MPNFLADETYADLPNFSITVTGKAIEDSTPTARDWLFGNPLRDQLTSGYSVVEPGIVAQNKDWNYWTNASGALRTLNQELEKAAKLAAGNKNWITGALVFAGVVIGAKAIFGGSSSRRR